MKNFIYMIVISGLLITVSSFDSDVPAGWVGNVDCISETYIFIHSTPYHDFDIVGTVSQNILPGETLDQQLEAVIASAKCIVDGSQVGEFDGLLIENENHIKLIQSKIGYGRKIAEVEKINGIYTYVRSIPVREYEVIKEVFTGQILGPGEQMLRHLTKVIVKAQQSDMGRKVDQFDAIITTDGNQIAFIKFEDIYFW